MSKGFSLEDDKNIQDLVMVVQLCEYAKNHWIIYFKKVSFRVCELKRNKIMFKESKIDSTSYETLELKRIFLGS